MRAKFAPNKDKGISASERKIVSDILGKESTNDPALSEILEIVRISQETHEARGYSEEKNRRVISSGDFREELNVVRHGS